MNEHNEYDVPGAIWIAVYNPQDSSCGWDWSVCPDSLAEDYVSPVMDEQNIHTCIIVARTPPKFENDDCNALLNEWIDKEMAELVGSIRGTAALG